MKLRDVQRKTLMKDVLQHRRKEIRAEVPPIIREKRFLWHATATRELLKRCYPDFSSGSAQKLRQKEDPP